MTHTTRPDVEPSIVSDDLDKATEIMAALEANTHRLAVRLLRLQAKALNAEADRLEAQAAAAGA